MKARWWGFFLVLVGFSSLVLTSCASAQPTIVVPTSSATPRPTETPFVSTPIAGPQPTEITEERLIEVEWPPELRLGDSDIVRLALIPSEEGYVAEVEFPDHEVETEEAIVEYQPGYEAIATARMVAVGLTYEPRGEQSKLLVQATPLTWRWTIFPESAGRHRLQLLLNLRWVRAGEEEAVREVPLLEQGLEVQVKAPLGLSSGQARIVGLAGLFVGGILALPLAEYTVRRQMEQVRGARVQRLRPNRELSIEARPGHPLSDREETLLQALYNRYARVVVLRKFASGYSGAQTYLIQPFHKDGRADAHAIVKIGSRSQIQGEFANFDSFVRHTLPPMTSRVLGPPVVVPGLGVAALEYTFVGTPGEAPVSLRDFALHGSREDFSQIIEERLFNTFGATWWKQRKPYHFRLAAEYDRLLPVHLILEAMAPSPRPRRLTGDLSQLEDLKPDDAILIEKAQVSEVREHRQTATVELYSSSIGFPLRIRYRRLEGHRFVEGQSVHHIYGRAVKTRRDILEEEVAKAFPGMDLAEEVISVGGMRLPNPLLHVDALLMRRVQGTQSIIHGDLNLENVLVGPGDLVWLIDFAATREGHALFDFARLEAELTTQVVAPLLLRHGLGLPDFFQVFEGLERGINPGGGPRGEIHEFLATLRRVGRRCLFDPAEGREFLQALILAYLGTLKFSNLDDLEEAPFPKQLSFAAAGYLLALEGGI